MVRTRKLFSRCSCCNKTNSIEVSDGYLSEYTTSNMLADPKDITKAYCTECLKAINEANAEFEEEPYDPLFDSLDWDYLTEEL